MLTLKTFAVMVLVALVTAFALHGLQLLIAGTSNSAITGALTAIVVIATTRMLTRKQTQGRSATNP